MKTFLLLCTLIISFTGQAQKAEEDKILLLLAQQADDWGRGDLEAFMKPYWKSDSLMFIGKSGVNKGWAATLENYKKGYPDTTAMGKLAFDILELRKISTGNYFVVGKWMLTRTIGNLNGHFTLWFRKIKGNWYIVADHSS